MTTAIAKKQSFVNKTNRALTQMEKLIEGLAPNPAEWVYNGECKDLGATIGNCVCGHEIRYEFIVERNGEKRILGSVCIENYAFFSPAMADYMRQDLERMLEKIAEDKRIAEMQKNRAEIDAARSNYEKLIAELKELVEAHIQSKPNSRYPLPYDLWLFSVGSGKVKTNCPEYKTPAPYLKWYKKQTEIVSKIIAGNQVQPMLRLTR